MVRDKSAKKIADDYGITPVTLYHWKDTLLGSEKECIMKNKKLDISEDNEKEKLTQKIEQLKKEVYRLQMEKDILEKAALILKKRKGHQSWYTIK